jgi:hypothetical protein
VCRGFLLSAEAELLCRNRLDGSESTAAATIGELDAASDLGEERVIGTNSDVWAGLNARAALAHDDRTPGHQLAGASLDPEPLRV